MDDSGLASLGFAVVCIFSVLLFFGVVLLPVLLLVYALASSAKQEQPEKSQEDTQVVVQEPSSEKPVENTKEAAIERLRAKGVNIRSDVVVKR
tara:strand:- start:71832 stop:72110 length:279 start_codon:yes stop_codon:yes gene_type:complete